MILVASYCRVSTDKDDQANSFEAQQRYFKEYIDLQPDWELYRIYADEGISGTSTKKRVEFNRMINDAKMGKFQLIITKEVSRLSRNILDTIAYTRELRSLGIGVLFMNDGINTLEPDAELRLSIMGSIAQEESRKTSTRVKWGQARQMERGIVFGRPLLGYDVKNGRITINPEGAEVVRLIFHKYGVEKKGTSIIARELRDDFATQVLETAIGAVLESHKWTMGEVTACTEDMVERSKITEGESSEQLEYDILQITKKKEGILDAFFSRCITKDEMRLMNERYDYQLDQLRNSLIAAREREQLSYETSMLKSDVKAHIDDLAAKVRDEIFFRNILDTMIVRADRRVEVRLNLLPQKWRFVLDFMETISKQLPNFISLIQADLFNQRQLIG